MTLTPSVVLVKANPLFGFPSRLACLFNRVKNAQVVHFVVVADVSHPLVDVVRKSDARHPALVGDVSFLVECVKKFGNIPKVLPSVVGSIAIDVVNLAARHLPGHKQKRKAMRLVRLRLDPNHDIALGLKTSGFPAFVLGIPHFRLNLGGHAPLSAAKHVWSGRFIEKLTRLRAVCNPFGQVGLVGHQKSLYNYFMAEYGDSYANVNRRAT